jgi:hypothetical protein
MLLTLPLTLTCSGMVLQYTVLPSIGWAISRFWGLQASLAIGVALVSLLQRNHLTAFGLGKFVAKLEAR